MMSDEMAASLHAQIAELRAQLANRDAEIADDHLENQYLFQIAELRGRVAKHKATIAERDATVLSLRAQLAERDALIAEVTKTLGGYSDSNLLSLATTVAIGYQQWSDGHDAMTDNLRAQLAERGMELVIKEMRIDSLTAALDDVRNRWHDAEQDWMQLRAQLAERSREIAELRAAIVRLCGNAKTTLDLNEWLEIYAPEQWFAGYDVAESALMALKDYSESIVYLRAQVATLTERLSRCTCTDDDGNEAP